MNSKSRIALTILLVFLCGLNLAQTPEWKRLGKRTVKFSTDRDVIRVAEKEGTFRAIKLKIRKSGVNMLDLKVHFQNGGVFDVKVRSIIPAGGETRVINLPGADRRIEKVVFWY